MIPKVNVIIPNYNHVRFLEERIQSVLAQTYQDYELIILDDCSPDGGASKAIIEKYRSNPHVSHIVYNEVNSGSTFKQWHKGIELARGEYIWIAESDDSCDKRLLEKLMEAITENNAIMAFCRSLQFDENGITSNFTFQNRLDGDFVLDGNRFIQSFLVDRNRVANASSVVFKRSTAVNVAPCYQELKAVGDWLFWILLAEHGKVCFIDEELNYFRWHSLNTTKTNIQNGTEAKETFVIHQHLVKRGMLKCWGIYTRTKRVNGFLAKPYDVVTQQEILKIWDRWYFFRFLNIVYNVITWLKKIK